MKNKVGEMTKEQELNELMSKYFKLSHDSANASLAKSIEAQASIIIQSLQIKDSLCWCSNRDILKYRKMFDGVEKTSYLLSISFDICKRKFDISKSITFYDYFIMILLNEIMNKASIIKKDTKCLTEYRALKAQAAIILYTKALRNSLFNAFCRWPVVNIYPPEQRWTLFEDAFQRIVSDSLNVFDAEYSGDIKNANFYGYLKYRLECSVKDITTTDYKVTSTVDENGENQKKYEKRVIDMPIQTDDEGNEAPIDMPDFKGDVESAVDTRLRFLSYVLNMSVCVEEIMEHRNDDDDNGLHRIYFPLFATDKYVTFAKMGGHRIIPINQRKAFDVMSEKFLDYTLVKTCHSLSDIEATPFKTYAQIDEANLQKGRRRISTRTVGMWGWGGKNAVLGSPFLNAVFLDFLGMPDDNNSQSTLDRQRKAFLEKIVGGEKA